MKKTLAGLLSCVLLCTGLLTITASATSSVGAAVTTSFWDVSSGHWAYDAVTAVAKQGMFSGTSAPDANGVGTFSPDRAMSRAEFLVPVVRYLYNDQLSALTGGEKWWSNAYQVAKDNNLLTYSNFEGGKMDAPINRYEAARLLVWALGITGETPPSLISEKSIPEYEDMPFTYQHDVLKAYSMGVMGGVDQSGTFAGEQALTRAQAAVLLQHMIDPNTRAKVVLLEPTTANYLAWRQGNDYKGCQSVKRYIEPEFLAYNRDANPYDTRTGHSVSSASYKEYGYDPPLENQTWVEGEIHQPPQVGDTIIKKDGTAVVLKLGPGNVLGACQGVDCITGTTRYGVTIGTELGKHNQVLGTASWYGDETTPFYKDPITGEVHSQMEWQNIKSAIWPGEHDLDKYKNGDIVNTWYQMDKRDDSWTWIGP